MADAQTIKNVTASKERSNPPKIVVLLKKYLTEDVMNKLKGRKTKLGATLWDVIQSGVKNLDSLVGVGRNRSLIRSRRRIVQYIQRTIRSDNSGLPYGFKRTAPTYWGESHLSELVNLDPDGKYVISTSPVPCPSIRLTRV